MTTWNFKGSGALAAAFALTLAGCATDTPREPRLGSRETVSAGGRIETEAMAFESFMRRARGIDAGFSDAGEVSRALQTGASHEANQLQAGMVAYAAMAALQEPGFAAAVQRANRDGSLARRLAADPSVVAETPGFQAAAGRASGALLRQGQGLAEEGRRVKQAAYSVQRQGWSKTRVADPAGRLARVKRISAVRYAPEAGDAERLRAAVAEGGRGGSGASAVVNQGVALAALSVMGQADRGRALMSEPRASSCLRLAKLNLYQCLASAGPQYEDIYCLGQHAMMETAQCVTDAARRPAPRRTRVAQAGWSR